MVIWAAKANKALHSAQINPPSPFEFDLLSLTFPAMCLQCLSAPPTLFSSHSIPTTRSWSVEPPGLTQFESLQRWLETKLQAWRQRTRTIALEKQHQMNGLNGHLAHNQLSTEVSEETCYTNHLHDAFQAWKALPDKQKQETWRTETLRAYAREQEKRCASDSRLHRLEQETQHLRAQLALLSKCQQPQDFLLFPPTTLPLPPALATAASSYPDFDPADWDYDRLVTKWRSRLQSSRSMAGQSALPGAAVKNWNLSTPTSGANGTAAAGTPALVYGEQEHGHGVQRRQARRVDSTEDAECDEEYEDEGGGRGMGMGISRGRRRRCC